MDNPDYAKALARALDLRDQILSDVENVDGGGPLSRMLKAARNEAIDAMAALIVANPDDAKLVRALQNQIARYSDTLRWTRSALVDGGEAWQALSIQEQDELREILNHPPEGTIDA